MDPFAIEETLQIPADVVNGKSLNRATKSESVFRSTCNVSQTFFLGLRTSSGSPSKPENLTLSPMTASLGGSTSSTWILRKENKQTHMLNLDINKEIMFSRHKKVMATFNILVSHLGVLAVRSRKNHGMRLDPPHSSWLQVA